MRCYAVFLFVASILWAAPSVRSSCLVNFGPSASLRGSLNQTFDNGSYCAFLGIRYAEPPVGDLRFRHSIVREPKGHQNHTIFGNRCPQFTNNILDGDEDCLFMNIYTPKVEASADEADGSPFPVLVFVHGGSYVMGWAERDIDGVDLLMDNGIVVVTFNYRLFTLGFLKSDGHNVPGNFGLKDQTTLLRWVQRYIHLFGGDPTSVTFAGHSAGASSVTHHLYIEQSRGLFHRMVSLSGSLLGSWSFLYDDKGCIDKYLNDLPPRTMERLNSCNFRDFLPGTSWEKYSIFFSSLFVPCTIPAVESAEQHGDNYTVRSPHESVLQTPINAVPIIVSETALEVEGLFGDVDSFSLGENVPKHVNDSMRSMINSTMYRYAAKLIAEGAASSYGEVFRQISSTFNLQYPIRRLVQDLSHTLDPSVPVYFQRFEFDGKFGKAKNNYYADRANSYGVRYGALHTDDLGYIFSPFNLREALDRPEDFRREWSVLRRTVELMVNFIKFGNPTPTPSKLSNLSWPAVNGKKQANLYLNVDEEFELRPMPEDIGYQEWEKMYDCLYYERCESMKI